MATKIVTKNSSTGGSAPSASDLVQGELAVNVTDKRLYTENASGAIVELGTSPSTIDINAGTIDGTTVGAASASTGAFTTLSASGEITANGGIALGDSDKATFGAGDDLQIYHDGSNSYVKDAGTGYLVLGGQDTGVAVQNGSGQNLILTGANAVTLAYGNAQKFATTATGIDVTGSVTADNAEIGTGGASDANAILDLTGDTTYTDFGFRIIRKSGANAGTDLRHRGTGDLKIEAVEAAAITFETSDTERMRIDSSGNVLVGQTSGSSSDAGHIFNPIGVAFHIRDGGVPLVAVRKTNDGELIQLKKDTTVVGSIGVDSGDNLYITGGSGSTGGFYIDDTQILPATSGPTLVDNTLNLGRSATRFKDLYLSGGVVFGTTGGSVSSKTLDDYEEGTWTPTGFSGGTLYNARYTKVGRLVTVSAYVNGTTFTSASMGGLPFTSEQGWSAGTLGLNDSTNINNCEVASASTAIQFRQGATSVVPNGSGLMVSATYHAA